MSGFVDTETARASRGVRIITSPVVPSPWSEAAKGLFRVAGVPATIVRQARGDSTQVAWMQSHNVPVVFHDDEPPRSVWSQIVALAARMGEPGALLPLDLDRRFATIGAIHELAGEDGEGWNARLFMIHASFTSDGKRGFPLQIAKYLAPKYGYAPDRVDAARAQVIASLAALGARLGDREYFGGQSESAPGALDVYAATFLTPLSVIHEGDCVNMTAPLRAAFAVAHEELGDCVPAVLRAHRTRMFERHLAWPIEI